MTELENYQPNPEYQIALPSVTSFVDQSGTSQLQPGIQAPEQQLIGQNGFLSEVRDDSVIEHNYNHYKVVKRTLFELLL